MKQKATRILSLMPYRITIYYFILASLWILVSDRLLGTLFPSDLTLFTQYASVKGILFVVFTSILLFISLNRNSKAIQKSTALLRENEQHLNTLYNAFSSGLLIYDLNGTITHVNETACHIFGVSADKLVGHTEILPSFRMIHEDGTPFTEVERPMRRALDEGEAVHGYVAGFYHSATDSYRWILGDSQPLVDSESGKLFGVAVTFVDITAFKQAQASLENSERKFRTLINTAKDAIFIVDAETGIILDVNLEAENMTGIPAKTLVGMNRTDILVAKDDEANGKHLESLLRDGRVETYADELRRFDRAIIPVEVSSSSVRIDGQKVILAILRDITERKRIEDNLRESEARFLAIYHNAPIMVDSFDKNGKCILWNDECTRQLGYTEEEMLSLENPLAVFYPDPDYYDYVKQHVLRRQGKFIEFTPRDKAGNIHYQLWADFELPDGSTISVGHDITEQKESEAKLRSSEANYRAIFGSVNDGIFVLHPESGAILDVNNRILDLYGYTPEEARSLAISDVSKGDEAYGQEAALHLIHLAAKGEPQVFDWVGRAKDGHLLWVGVSLRHAVLGGEDRVLAIVRDISERKKTEQALQNSERRLAQIVNFLPDPTFVINLDGKVTVWNWAMEELTGVPNTDILGKGNYEYSIPLYGERSPMLANLVIHPELIENNRYTNITREGRTIMAEGHAFALPKGDSFLWGKASPIYDAEGNLIGAIESIHDITERKKSEEALRLTQFSVDHVADAIYLVKPDGRISYVNNTAVQMLGYSQKELLSLKAVQIHPDIETDPNFSGWDNFCEKTKQLGSQIIETRHFTKDGDYIPVEIRASYMNYQGSEYVCAIVRDITERKKTEEQLRASEANYRSIFNAANDAVIIHDIETGEITDANQKAFEMYGYSPQELKQLKSVNISSGDPLYDQDAAMRWMKRAATGEPQLFEWKARSKDGRQFWVEVSIKRAPIGGKDQLIAIIRDITERKRTEEEIRLRDLRERQIHEEAEEAKREFYKGTINAVTDGRLNLVSYREIREKLYKNAAIVEINSSKDLSEVRAKTEIAAKKLEMEPDRIDLLITAVGEAAGNVVKHAPSGVARIALEGDVIQVCIQDNGKGMDTLLLPKATLMKGFSTKPSLGLGYSLILAAVDVVYLATDKAGTWLLMEMKAKETAVEFNVASLPDYW